MKTIDYRDYLWGDSVLKRVTVKSDKIQILVFNDYAQKDVCIFCNKCVGISEMITWDDVYIDNIEINEELNTPNILFDKAVDMYGYSTVDLDKSLTGRFKELSITLVSDFTFTVVCRDIVFLSDD